VKFREVGVNFIWSCVKLKIYPHIFQILLQQLSQIRKLLYQKPVVDAKICSFIFTWIHVNSRVNMLIIGFNCSKW